MQFNWTLLLPMLVVQLAVLRQVQAFDCLECSDCADASKVSAKTCPDTTASSCFIKNVDGVISRGCGDGSCGENDAKCLKCSSSGCNNHNVCKSCDTSDASCSQTAVSDNKYNAICSAADTQCFVNIKDKKVERRCALAQDTCSTTGTCLKCAGANCNAGIFPTDRRQCLQCSGTDCNAATTTSTKPCLNYEAADKCFTIGTGAENMKRGCVSDEGACTAGSEGCVQCEQNSCNNLTYENDPKFACISCDSTKDVNCRQQQTADKATACTKKVRYDKQEACYTKSGESGITRGCLLDDFESQAACGQGGTCDVCSDSKGCNLKAIEFTCIVCRSDNDPGCYDDADKIGGQACRTGASSEAEGCFHGLWNGIAIRGCYIDADDRMKVICSDKDDNQCQLCHTKDCNKEKTSGAAGLTISATLAIFSLAMIGRWGL